MDAQKIRKAAWLKKIMQPCKKNIGVMSGKGGVGKSSISVLIAKHLKQLGHSVGELSMLKSISNLAENGYKSVNGSLEFIFNPIVKNILKNL